MVVGKLGDQNGRHGACRRQDLIVLGLGDDQSLPSSLNCRRSLPLVKAGSAGSTETCVWVARCSGSALKEAAMSNAHPGRILPQDVVPQDGWGDMITALPVSQAEIEELLYGEDRPPQERVDRLKELAAQMREQEPGDFGDGDGLADSKALLLEIDEAIARLSGDMERDPELAYDEVSTDDDPLNHRETLSPDSDELEELEDEDEESIRDDAEPLPDEALDPAEWDDGDGFDVDRGVK